MATELTMTQIALCVPTAIAAERKDVKKSSRVRAGRL
jgi:hypothetical protein